MEYTTKYEIQKKARLNRGILNLLKDDIDCICIDADTYDLFTIGDSIKDARDTIRKLNDNLIKLEYLVATAIGKCSR